MIILSYAPWSMTLTSKDLEHLAGFLSALGLSEEEKQKMGPQLEDIIALVGQLSAIDTSDVAYQSHLQAEGYVATEGVVSYDDPEGLLRNVQHQVEQCGIVLKTSLKGK